MHLPLFLVALWAIMVKAIPIFEERDGAPPQACSNIKTLMPATHWDHDLNDFQNLVPSTSADLYYSDSGVAGETL